MKSLAFPIILFVLSLNACGTEIILHNATDLINLSNNVSSGSVYFGTTILLDSDIDFDGFSDIFEPIGKDSSHYFNGTFDGQGHMIKNLAMNSTTLSDVGFIGWALSATIRNIMFDPSCSFINYETPNINLGMLGPISYFKGSDNGECIENIVNMARITFASSGTNYVLTGGIAGKTDAYSCIRNCVNYGNITITGSANYVFVGGIVSNSIGDKSSSTNNVIRSCINYGYISNSISGNYVFVGGIVGYAQRYFLIDSCVGAGEISSPSSSKAGGIIGAIYETSTSKSIMNNSYWTSDINGYNRQFDNRGDIKSSYSESVEEMDETVLDKLNGGSSSSSSGDDNAIWLLNSNGKTVTFFVNDKVYLTSTSPMILMPSFDKDNFDGWYTDKACTTLLASLTVTSDANFYGIYKSQVTVMFDANGGNLSESVSSSITVIYSEEYGGLPGATRTEHSFDGWFTEPAGGSKITAYSVVTDSESHTLYAHWTPNTYTVTFDFANGTTLNSTFGYNQPIEYPENETLIKEGYTFNGWDKEIILMPAQNITITAYWIEIVQSSSSSSSSSSTVNHIISSSSSSMANSIESSSSNSSSIVNHIESSSNSVVTGSSKVGYEYVKIVFGNKDLSKDDVERIVRAYTDDSFTIERIETDDDNTIRVIIKFTDAEKAESFIETIKIASDSNINIVSVDYFLPEILSSSPSIVPFISAFLILLYFMY